MAAIPTNLSQWSEEELARQAQAGSSASFGELCERYRPRLMRYLGRRLYRPQDAEDVAQETLARAFANLGAYQAARPFANWLFTLAANLAATHCRRGSREVLLDEIDRADPAQCDPSDQVAQAQQSENLWAMASQKLPERQYQAMWLRYGQDLPVKAVAQTMRLTTIHVKVLLHRARKRLLNSPSFVRSLSPDSGPSGDVP